MNAKAIMLNCEKMQFKNKETGEVTHMTKIQYAIAVSPNDNFVGYSVLECFVNENAFKNLKNCLGKMCDIVIETKGLKNGVKYIIKTINGNAI